MQSNRWSEIFSVWSKAQELIELSQTLVAGISGDEGVLGRVAQLVP